MRKAVLVVLLAGCAQASPHKQMPAATPEKVETLKGWGLTEKRVWELLPEQSRTAE
jgi:hypothetical protein